MVGASLSSLAARPSAVRLRSCTPLEPRRQRNKSLTSLVSLAARLLAKEEKTTSEPSLDMTGEWLSSLAVWLPASERHWIVPLTVSRRKMSHVPLVSLGTKFSARLSKATERPAPLIRERPLSREDWTPPGP